jgi:hypothetical protein
MYFSCAIRILINRSSDINYANDLLSGFVEKFKLYYPENKITHNVHSLLHLASDASKFEAVDAFSAFPYENNMQFILSMISKYNQPLQQIHNRQFEHEYFFEEAIVDLYPRIPKLGKALNRTLHYVDRNHTLLKNVQFLNLLFSAQDKDKYCFVENDGREVPIEILEVCSQEGELKIVGKVLKTITAFDNPISSDLIGIILHTGYSHETFKTFPVNQISGKIFKIENFIVLKNNDATKKS